MLPLNTYKKKKKKKKLTGKEKEHSFISTSL